MTWTGKAQSWPMDAGVKYGARSTEGHSIEHTYVGPWPVTDGHFEIELSIEGAVKVGDAILAGGFLPGGRVEGTLRVILFDPPEPGYDVEPCDTGEIPWSGMVGPVPTSTPAPSPVLDASATPGELPQGGAAPPGGGVPALTLALGIAASMIGLGAAGRVLLRRR